MIVVVVLLILLGMFFLVVAAVGVLRLPDVFTRSHALSVTDTLGVGLVLGGLAIYQGWTATAVKTVLILLFLYHVNPVIAHSVVRAALRSGLSPWTREQSQSASPGLKQAGTGQES